MYVCIYVCMCCIVYECRKAQIGLNLSNGKFFLLNKCCSEFNSPGYCTLPVAQLVTYARHLGDGGISHANNLLHATMFLIAIRDRGYHHLLRHHHRGHHHCSRRQRCHRLHRHHSRRRQHCWSCGRSCRSRPLHSESACVQVSLQRHGAETPRHQRVPAEAASQPRLSIAAALENSGRPWPGPASRSSSDSRSTITYLTLQPKVHAVRTAPRSPSWCLHGEI